MKYSTPFLQQAALAARGDLPASRWMRLPIGQRVTAIYEAIRRIEADHAESRRDADAREQDAPAHVAERLPAG
ncbi:MAG: hypothetical protein JSR21_01590 [Proteobacteria bacterium]|nr:hypothetical protein [Pseudomonadota bacterium]